MSPAQTSRTLSIGFVLLPGMLTTGTALPYEMWAAADDRRRAARLPGPRLALHAIGCGGDEVASYGRLPIAADCTPSNCPTLDVVYLPALWRGQARATADGERLRPWLLGQYEQGAAVAAVGTGVSLLAASGLLDGRAATTHWYDFDRFEARFPAVDLKRRFFITQSGALYCAASINSLADVTVHLIERAYGRATAQHVERNFSHEIRRTYEEYRYLDGGDASLDDEVVIEAQDWMRENPSSPFSLAQLAARLGVSARTLARRFRAATGTSPGRYWQRQRIRLAKDLLESTNLTIGEIAYRVGYQDAGHFGRLFRREMSIAPSDYRQTVRAKLFRHGSGGVRTVKEFDNSAQRKSAG